MFKKETYLREIKRNLEKNKKKVIKKLDEIAKLKIKKETGLIDFEVFDNMEEGITIMVYAMDEEANQVQTEKEDEFGTIEILIGCKLFEIRDEEYDDFMEAIEEDYDDVCEAKEEVIKEWFVECFEKSKMKNIKSLIYFKHHNDYRSYDIRKEEYVEDQEKWLFW